MALRIVSPATSTNDASLQYIWFNALFMRTSSVKSAKKPQKGCIGAIRPVVLGSYTQGRRRAGAEMPFHNNFMIYQDRLEASSLQLFVHPENWLTTFFVFYKFPLPSTLLLPYRCSGVSAYTYYRQLFVHLTKYRDSSSNLPCLDPVWNRALEKLWSSKAVSAAAKDLLKGYS